MIDLPNAKLKTEFVNDFGETMKMVIDSNDDVWVHHTSYNNDYIELEDFNHYSLSISEVVILASFSQMVMNFLRPETMPEFQLRNPSLN